MYNPVFTLSLIPSFLSCIQGDNSHWRRVPLSSEGDVSTQILPGLWVTVPYLYDKHPHVILQP